MKNIVCFFSNANRAVPIIEKILDDGNTISAIYCATKDHENKQLFKLRKDFDFDVVNLPNSFLDKNFIDCYKSYNPSLTLLLGFNKIIPDEIIKIPNFGTFNLHGGPLPHYRGGSALNWQIINGEKELGISINEVDSGIDTGKIASIRYFSLLKHQSISDAHKIANKLFIEMTADLINRLNQGQLELISQNHDLATYWHQRNDEDGKISWGAMDAEQIINLIRAITTPYPGAYTLNGAEKIRIFSAELPKTIIKGTPGKVLFLGGGGPYIVCKDRAIKITNYQCEYGGKLKQSSLLGQ